MTVISATASHEHSIYATLELSKNSWLLAIQVPGRDNPSLHPIKGGDTEGLMAKLNAARDQVIKDSVRRRRGRCATRLVMTVFGWRGISSSGMLRAW